MEKSRSRIRQMLYWTAKRALDFSACALALFFLWPLMLAVAVWVRLDSAGPALYRQKRVGLNGREFYLLKFRTMSATAEKDSGPVWAIVNDTRITRAGKILRKLYLDELPQLFNILWGDMSLVGPRPERPFFYPVLEKEIPGFHRRYLVKPGLTGLAQVRQAHQASIPAVKRKFSYDLIYLENGSFWLDLQIIWRTCSLMLKELKEVYR